MPSCPIAIPSSMAMVLNSLATPPAASISRATSWPRSFRWTWPGTNCVKELAIAMIGLPKSESFRSELLGDAAGGLDLARDELAEVFQMDMARHELREGIGDRDDRLAEVGILPI